MLPRGLTVVVGAVFSFAGDSLRDPAVLLDHPNLERRDAILILGE